MEYNEKAAYASGSLAQDVSPERPYLARLGEVADELERIGNYIEGFLDRCRGGGREQAAKGPTPVPSGHLGQLERLTGNLARVDMLARNLQVIG